MSRHAAGDPRSGARRAGHLRVAGGAHRGALHAGHRRAAGGHPRRRAASGPRRVSRTVAARHGSRAAAVRHAPDTRARPRASRTGAHRRGRGAVRRHRGADDHDLRPDTDGRRPGSNGNRRCWTDGRHQPNGESDARGRSRDAEGGDPDCVRRAIRARHVRRRQPFVLSLFPASAAPYRYWIVKSLWKCGRPPCVGRPSGKWCPAVSYSPTPSPVQYHRR